MTREETVTVYEIINFKTGATIWQTKSGQILTPRKATESKPDGQ